MGIKAAFDGKENSNQIKTTRIIKGVIYLFSLHSVYTCRKILLVVVPGDVNIDYRGRPADADGPKM